MELRSGSRSGISICRNSLVFGSCQTVSVKPYALWTQTNSSVRWSFIILLPGSVALSQNFNTSIPLSREGKQLADRFLEELNKLTHGKHYKLVHIVVPQMSLNIIIIIIFYDPL